MTAYHRHVSSHSSLMNLKVLVPDPQIKLLSAHLYRPFCPSMSIVLARNHPYVARWRAKRWAAGEAKRSGAQGNSIGIIV